MYIFHSERPAPHTFLLAVNVLGRLASKAISSKRADVSSTARNSCLVVFADHVLSVQGEYTFERIQGAACSMSASHKQCAMWRALLLLPCRSHVSCMQGEHMFERIQGGLLNDGLCSVFAALGTILPTTTFAENNGVVSLTRCAGCAIQVLLFLSSFWGVCVLGLSVDWDPRLRRTTALQHYLDVAPKSLAPQSES